MSLPANRRRIVVLAFGVGLLVWSLGLFAPAVLLPYLHATHGWPVSTISAAITAHFLASACTVAVMPEIHRTLGLRGTVLAGAVAVYLGFIAWTAAPSIYLLFLAAVLSGAGLACGAAVTVNAIINVGFSTERAKALGIALNGAALGGILVLPLLTFGGRQWGFVATLAVTGAVALVALLWLSLSRTGGPNRSATVPARPTPTGASIGRRALFASPRFRSLAFSFAIAVFVQVGVYSQLINRLRPIFGTDGAALVMTGCVLLAILGRSTVAWNIGAANRRLVAAVTFLMQAAGVAMLAFAATPALAIAGCVLFGLGLGNLPLLPPLIVQQEFDDESFGLVLASVSAVNQVILAFGPVTIGLLYDASGAYTLPFAIGAVLYLLAAAIVTIHARPGAAFNKR